MSRVACRLSVRSYRQPFIDACVESAPPDAQDWFEQLDDVTRTIIAPAAVEADRRSAYPAASVRALRAIGAFGVNAPRSAGGLGFGDGVAALAIETVATSCASTAAVLMFHLQVTRRVVQCGSRSQRDDLPRLASGEWLSSSAWTEAGAGADKSRLATRVEGPMDRWTITGDKTYCTGLEGAALIHVLAGVAQPDGIVAPTFVRVVRNAPGVDTSETYDLLGLRGSSTGTVRLRSVPVRHEDIVGAIGDGMRLMDANHDVLVNPGLLALGLARAAYEESKLVARGLRPGTPDLTQYQHTRFVLAQLEVQLTAAYAHAAHAVRCAAAGRPDSRLECLKVKVHASKMAGDVTATALQLCGSRAYATQWPLERHFRDARATSSMGPSTEVINERIAGYLMREPFEERA